ncbi:hypothetical protein ACFLYP_01235 [Chloroflexota bacterium]
MTVSRRLYLLGRIPSHFSSEFHAKLARMCYNIESVLFFHQEVIMAFIYQGSLAVVADSINQAFFFKQPISAQQKVKAALWIAGQQMLNGSHTGFSPPPEDEPEEVRLFTGEKLATQFAAIEITGVEACRAMMLLAPADPKVKAALTQANQGLGHACFANTCTAGECAHAAVAYWRYLAVGGMRDSEWRLEKYLQILTAERDGKGRWKGFPFYYTLLALSEIDLPEAKEELRYARPACERVLKRAQPDDKYGQRRREVLQRALS